MNNNYFKNKNLVLRSLHTYNIDNIIIFMVVIYINTIGQIKCYNVKNLLGIIVPRSEVHDDLIFLSLPSSTPMNLDTLEASKRFTKLPPPFYGVIYIRFAFSRFISKFKALEEICKVTCHINQRYTDVDFKWTSVNGNLPKRQRLTTQESPLEENFSILKIFMTNNYSSFIIIALL